MDEILQSALEAFMQEYKESMTEIEKYSFINLINYLKIKKDPLNYLFNCMRCICIF